MADPGMGTQILAWLWDKKEVIWGKLKDVAGWFRGKKGKPGLLIVGAGGVGKTTLGKILAGDYDLLLDLPGKYEESLEIERYTLTDAPDVEIVVPPGQQHRREASWAELQADITAGKFRGIILLAAYGHHSLGDISYKHHRLYANDKEAFLERYLEDRRAEELNVLRQLVPHVKTAGKRMRFLTVVAKRDLWFSVEADVKTHYQQGAYAAEIQTLAGQLGQRHFRHEFVFASLVISNFVTGKGERLKPNLAGYDHQAHVESLRRLFETVDALRNWEASP